MADLSEYQQEVAIRRACLADVAAACLGLAVAVSAWCAVSIWEERLARAKFNAAAGDYASVLEDGTRRISR